MDSDFPECANAYMHPVPAGHPHYRAIHTANSCVKVVAQRAKSADAYAENVIAENRDHFAQPITLMNGTQNYRKTIVNGGVKTASMETFARNRVADGYYAMTLNQLGVWVYRPGHEKKRYPTKGARFSKLLFQIYKELGLHDRPLFIVGRRKVDRGLGFHYAPREDEDDLNGLVWSDMILGAIKDKETAIQKAGRLAGVVAHCPQYPGTLTWWTDEKTSRAVLHHNKVVDNANTRRGCSALQAITRAEVAVPMEAAIHSSVSHLEEFASMDAIRLHWQGILLAAGKPKGPDPGTPNSKEGVYVCSIGEQSDKQSGEDIRNKFKGPSVANWGSGLTSAAAGDYIHRVYVGYDGETAVFFLRWTQKV
jgi:hypothetical protein